MNEFNEYVHECFSAAGDIVIKSMMGGYLVYLNGKLIGDVTADIGRMINDSKDLKYLYKIQ